MFAIRHKPTGFYLTTPYAKGGSHWEPSDPAYVDQSEVYAPRLFHTARAARCFRSAWAKGRWFKERGGSTDPWSGTYEYEENIFIEPVPSRKKEDLEIIPVTIQYGEPV